MLFNVLVAGHLRQNGLRTFISAAAVALGVAIVTILGIVDATTNASLAAAFEALDTSTNLQVIGPSGGFDERILARVRDVAGVVAARPVLSGRVVIAERRAGVPAGESVNVLGVDLLQRLPGDAEFRTEVPGPFAPRGSAPEPRALFADGAVVVSAPIAQRYHLRVGSLLHGTSGARTVALRVAAILNKPPSQYDSSVVFADLPVAQAMLARAGRLDRIDCVVDPAHAAEVGRAIEPLLPPGFHAVLPADAFGGVKRMLGSLHDCLALLALFSLVVGALLIASAVGVAVAQRRPDIGTLRTLGAKRGAIFGIFLLEGALLGAVGSGEGLALAIALTPLFAHAAVYDVFRMLGAGGAGIVFAAAAAIVPAFRAASAEPAIAVRSRGADAAVPGTQRIFVLAAIAFAAVAGTAALVGTLRYNAALGYWSGAAMLAAGVLGLPPAVSAAARCVGFWSTNAPGEMRLAATIMGAAPRRTAIAVASLGVTIAMMVCVVVVIDSSRTSVLAWAGAAATGEVRRNLIALFDSAFSATYALCMLSLAIGILGVVGTLFALVVERRRDIVVLRCLGLARTSVQRMLLAEAGFMGVLASLFGAAIGFWFALLLLYVIHPQTEGGSIRWAAPYGEIFALTGLVIAAVLIGGVLPARAASRMRTDDAVLSA
ncbi:MAG: transporter permease protein [Candidatus Eremiobacteraeota bacterium]|nr:transporter permease protein [Candidatus Eremiobacteraeota bacterium]